jgi:hypothetical protein
VRESFWQMRALVALLTLVVLVASRAWAQAPINGGSAQDFHSRTFDLQPKATATVALAFPAGKEAMCTVRCTKQTDVHLYVYDAARKMVAKDDSPGPNCDVKLKPTEAGTFTLKVTNEGPGENACTLAVELK